MIAVVANPTKLSDIPSMRDELEEIARSHGHELLWLETTADDPGAGQTRQALESGAELVCALGGDGTARTVASELAGTGTALGLLPGGTGNLLARNLGTPISGVSEAFEAALQAGDRPIDVGMVRLEHLPEQAFLVMVGMGLDAETMADTSEAVKARLGWLSYGLTGASKLFTRGMHAWVTASDGQRHDQHVRSVLVGNCGSVQGGVALLQAARVDDGLLDLLLFAPKGLLGWTAALWHLLTRSHRGHPSIHQSEAESYVVRVRRPRRVQVDGDPMGRHRMMRVRVEPGALLVRAPLPEPAPETQVPPSRAATD